MNKETEENSLNCAENKATIQNQIENAFSDLISEYFEEDSTVKNKGNINVGPVLDWESVANGQLYTNIKESAGTYGNIDTTVTEEKGALYNNLENINDSNLIAQEKQSVSITDAENNGIEGIYKNISTLNDGIGQVENEVKTTGIYNELGKINTETIIKNAYGVVTINGELLNGISSKADTNNEEQSAGNIQNVQSKDFKLTQGNLPAKIGFWTKVRNFFISDSKIQYSVQQSTQSNGGVWNKLQNFFSFGKNK